MSKLCGIVTLSLLLLLGCGTTSNVDNNPSFSQTELEYRIVSGNLYEITENNFIEGIDYDFSETEIEEIKTILKNEEFTLTEEIIDENELQYIINFYDADGTEIFSFALDKNKNIFCKDGYQLKDSHLREYICNIIEQQYQ